MTSVTCQFTFPVKRHCYPPLLFISNAQWIGKTYTLDIFWKNLSPLIHIDPLLPTCLSFPIETMPNPKKKAVAQNMLTIGG